MIRSFCKQQLCEATYVQTMAELTQQCSE